LLLLLLSGLLAICSHIKGFLFFPIKLFPISVEYSQTGGQGKEKGVAFFVVSTESRSRRRDAPHVTRISPPTIVRHYS
jgi:hypothetical protein